MPGYQGVKGPDGVLFQMPALDFTNTDQLTIGASSAPQSSAIQKELVFVFAQGGNVRLSVGAAPEASAGAGSIPLSAGSYIPVVKLRTDKIAIIRADDNQTGVVDIIAAKEIE